MYTHSATTFECDRVPFRSLHCLGNRLGDVFDMDRLQSCHTIAEQRVGWKPVEKLEDDREEGVVWSNT